LPRDRKRSCFHLPPDDPGRISERSWSVTIEEIRAKNYDLKATNQNAPDLSDKRTPAELMKIIEDAQAEIVAGLTALKR
jgi:type I restriction enzyme M protein